MSVTFVFLGEREMLRTSTTAFMGETGTPKFVFLGDKGMVRASRTCSESGRDELLCWEEILEDLRLGNWRVGCLWERVVGIFTRQGCSSE